MICVLGLVLIMILVVCAVVDACLIDVVVDLWFLGGYLFVFSDLVDW